jgi:hypothetical protein
MPTAKVLSFENAQNCFENIIQNLFYSNLRHRENKLAANIRPGHTYVQYEDQVMFRFTKIAFH